MMQIIGLCLLSVCFSLLLKQSGRREMALAVTLCASLYILSVSLAQMANLMDDIHDIALNSGLDGGIFQMVLKITGIAYIVQTASDLCKDAGESALAGKVELGGKLMICASALPAVRSIMELVAELL